MRYIGKIGKISATELQSIWINRLNDPLVNRMLKANNSAFFSVGLTNTTWMPFINYRGFWFHLWLNLPMVIKIWFPYPPISSISKEILYETVMVYALIHKLKLENDKGRSYTPCVDVCQSINNSLMIALAKAEGPLPPYHYLLKTEFDNFQVKADKKTIPPADCGILNCKKYRERIAKKYGECCNVLGNCAEQRAANYILREPACRATAVSHLRFSWAIRPRTMGIVPYCYNCTKIFPQLK